MAGQTNLALKIAKTVVTTIAVLIAIELVLQLAGWWMKPNPDTREGANAPPGAIRILALGESTTQRNGDKKVWTDLLEERLRAKGYKVFLVNKAQQAIDSAYMLANLEFFMDAVRPHIVVTMIGINDSNRWVAHVNRSPFRNIRLYRIATWLLINTLGRLRGGTVANGVLPVADPAFLSRAQPVNPDKLPPEDQARYYEWAVRQVPHALMVDDRLMKFHTLRMVRKSLATGYFVTGSVFYFAEVLSSSDKPDECFEMLRKYVATFQGIREPQLLVAAQMCAFDDKNPRWTQLLNANMWAIEYRAPDSGTSSPVKEIYRRVSQSGAALVAMNYPRRKFSDDMRSSIESLPGRRYLVENRDNFEEALSHHQMNEIFSDTFAGDFGHTTQLGHDLIADNVVPVVVQAIEDLKKDGVLPSQPAGP